MNYPYYDMFVLSIAKIKGSMYHLWLYRFKFDLSQLATLQSSDDQLIKNQWILSELW